MKDVPILHRHGQLILYELPDRYIVYHVVCKKQLWYSTKKTAKECFPKLCKCSMTKSKSFKFLLAIVRLLTLEARRANGIR